MKAHRPIFTSGPWRAADGDPCDPGSVLGVPVIQRLSRRPDGSGALVRLADRRYALTGATVAVGPRRKLERYLRRRGRDSPGDEWFAELRDILRLGPNTLDLSGGPRR